jgi:HK97 family phage prohead protease
MRTLLRQTTPADGEDEPMTGSCANCGHDANLHAGPMNDGACTAPGCDCPAFDDGDAAGDTEVEVEVEVGRTAPLERVTLVRSFDSAVLAAGDGRTLDTRIVPYGVSAIVADPPRFKAYREAFTPGAFERQIANPDRVRVWLNFEHEQGLRGIVGHGVALRDQADGLHGRFRVHENVDGDKALQLVRDGILTGLSLEFVALRSKIADGVVHRLRAHIDKVSLCRSPAYAGAEVLAVRQRPLEVERAEPALSADVTERLEALGVAPLRRMATTSKPWDGSASRFSDEQYTASTLFCRPGDGAPKERCSLPVLEPDGTLNVNALGAAASALAGGRGGLANATQAMRATAARKLIRYYNAVGKEPPASLVTLARS